MLTRYWRAVAADYVPPPPGTGCAEGAAWVKAAENRLRATLENGDRPEVFLVAPERASLPEIVDGVLVDGCAWAVGYDVDLAERAVPRPAAVSFMDAEDVVPDPWSDLLAGAGAVLARRARLDSIRIAPWLEPVAGQLVQRYGVPVMLPVGLETARPLPVVTSAPAYVERGVFNAEACAMLAQWFELKQDDDAALDDRLRDGLLHGAIPPPEIWPSMLASAQALADRFDLYADGALCGMLRYDVGGSQDWHTDANDDEPFSRTRTVSFSLLLSEPGEDFTGGEFETDHGVIPLHRGDLVGFTSRTRHRVRTVMSGHRLVLVCFGEQA